MHTLFDKFFDDFDHVRLDMYFAPTIPEGQVIDAEDDDGKDDARLVAHYRAEKVARGTYDAQIAAVEIDDDASHTRGMIVIEDDGRSEPITEPTVPGWRMPGLPACQDAIDVLGSLYDGVLWACSEPDWAQPTTNFRHILFDPWPVEREVEEMTIQGVEEVLSSAGPLPLPPVKGELVPMREGPDEIRNYSMPSHDMFGFAHRVHQYPLSSSHFEALERGWRTW